MRKIHRECIQPPSPPTWPSQFSASILATDQMGNIRFFRWFYDYVKQCERMDGMVDWMGDIQIASRIRDHAETTGYDIFYKEDEVSCFSKTINATMPEPNLSAFYYAGLSIVNYEKCNHWIMNEHSSGLFAQLWDTADTRELRRVDIVNQENGMAETWDFMEVDNGAQDANLFMVPELISNVCNSM